jgi:hypothetical protein
MNALIARYRRDPNLRAELESAARRNRARHVAALLRRAAAALEWEFLHKGSHVQGKPAQG